VIARICSLGALDHQHRDLHSIKLSYLTEDWASPSIMFGHNDKSFSYIILEYFSGLSSPYIVHIP
jgi:hypothetical protein